MDQFEDSGRYIQRSQNPRSQFKGWELSRTINSNNNSKILHSLHLSYSMRGGITLSPATETHNNANIEDRWVPIVLWLWRANRIKRSIDSKQLKQS